MISLRTFLISVILHCHNDIYNSSIYMKSSNWKIVKTKPLRRNERSIGLEQIKTQNVLYIPLAAGQDWIIWRLWTENWKLERSSPPFV